MPTGEGRENIPEVSMLTTPKQSRRIRSLVLSMTEIEEVLRRIEGLDPDFVHERRHKRNCKRERRGLDRMEIFNPQNCYEIHNGFVGNKGPGTSRNPQPELIIQGVKGWSCNTLDLLEKAFLEEVVRRNQSPTSQAATNPRGYRPYRRGEDSPTSSDLCGSGSGGSSP